MTDKHQAEHVSNFADFLESVNPQDFHQSSGSNPYEVLATTTNPADMADGIRRLLKLQDSGDESIESKREQVAIARNLASNDHLNAETVSALMLQFQAGLPIGTYLVTNPLLREEHHLLLAEAQDVKVRRQLSTNPQLSRGILRVLIRDSDDLVVMTALNNPNASPLLQNLARPEPYFAYVQFKAKEVVKIRDARSLEDFDACPSASFDARLQEAYVNNPHLPESYIGNFLASEEIAGELCRMNLEAGFYHFQIEPESQSSP